MEKTLKDIEYSRVPNRDEKALLGSLVSGCESVFLGAPALADDNGILEAVDWADGELTLIGQVDCPRNITAELTDADDSCTGLLTITGLDPQGRTITETLAPDGEGGGKVLVGTKIFAKVVSAVISNAEGGETMVDQIIIGFGNTIGLPWDISVAASVIHTYLGGVYSAATIKTGVSTSGVDASAGTYDGAKMLQVFANPAKVV